MSGLVSVALTFWEKIHNSTGKYVLYAVAVMCVFLSAFQAWQDEHRALLAEQEKHKPNLAVDFGWISTGTISPDPNSGTLVLVTGNITNSGEMPSIVRRWYLEITLPNKKALQGIPLGYEACKRLHLLSPNFQSFPGTNLDVEKDYWPDITARNAIGEGSGVPGFVVFRVPGLFPSDAYSPAKLTLCHEDVLYRKNCESTTSSGGSARSPGLIPGMHYESTQ